MKLALIRKNADAVCIFAQEHLPALAVSGFLIALIKRHVHSSGIMKTVNQHSHVFFLNLFFHIDCFRYIVDFRAPWPVIFFFKSPQLFDNDFFHRIAAG